MPKFEVVGLVVAEMAASLAFYRRLGVDFPEGSESEGHVEATNTDIRLALDTVEVIRSFDAEWSPPAGGHQMSLAFRCDSPADVDRVYSDLIASGVEGHKEPWDAFWGQRYAEVKDPDGNIVDLFADLS
jgi:uncharacterized glyoxalase superfamily protein PhnB